MCSDDFAKDNGMEAQPLSDIGVPDRRIHLAYLDGLRALAALYVMLFNSLTTFDSAALPAFLRPVRDVFSFGQEAVDVFIVLSGFCLMLPVIRTGSLRGGARAFYQRRALRLLPTYYIALLFAIGVDVFAFHDGPTLHAVIAHLLLVHDMDYADDIQINSALWSIAVEVHISLLFPLLVGAWRRFGPAKTVAGAIAAGYGLQWVLAPTGIYTGLTGTSVWFIGLFAVGMFGAGVLFDDSLQALRARVRWGLCALILGAMGIGLTRVSVLDGHSLYPMTDLLAGAAASCLIVHAAASGRLAHVLSWRPLVAIGAFSYSLYLIHYPLLALFAFRVLDNLHLTPAVSLAALWLVAAPLCVLCASLFYRAFERPFLPGQKAKPRVELSPVLSLTP